MWRSNNITTAVWRSNNISTATKVKLYGTFVIPVMMYGSECWCLRKEERKRKKSREKSVDVDVEERDKDGRQK